MPLRALKNFAAEASDPSRYTALGTDWSIASADVIGSTGLANSGRHRDVNFVAGAAVAVLSSAIEAMGETPCCQFGGDGAVAAVPPACRDRVERVLAALAWWSINEMKVPIRVGMVPVGELAAAGHEVRVAVQDFGGGNSFGLFYGSGVTVAEEWVKRTPSRQIEPAPGEMPGLDALSCRWTPVLPSRGDILCIIIDPIPPGEAGGQVLTRLSRDLEAIIRTDAAAPLSRYGERLKPKWPPSWRSLCLEARVVPKGQRLKRVLQALFEIVFMRLTMLGTTPRGGFDPVGYPQAMAERSDYRKAAGGPRLVLDVTDSEAAAIEALLESYVTAGDIRFGTARSEATSITCFVGDFARDRHVHFVDGTHLGFWRASQVLKARFYGKD